MVAVMLQQRLGAIYIIQRTVGIVANCEALFLNCWFDLYLLS